MQYVIYIFFMLVSVIGLSEIVHNIHLYALSKKVKNITLICRLGEKFPDLELKYLSEQKKWFGSNYAEKIVAIANIDERELLDKCIKIASKEDILLINNENSSESEV